MMSPELCRAEGTCCGLHSMVAPMLGAFAAVSGAILGAHLISAIAEGARSIGLDRDDLKKVIKALELGYDTSGILRGKRVLHCGDPEVEKLLWAS